MMPLTDFLNMVGKLRANDPSVYMKNSMYYSNKKCSDLKFENITIQTEGNLKFVIPDEYWKKD